MANRYGEGIFYENVTPKKETEKIRSVVDITPTPTKYVPVRQSLRRDVMWHHNFISNIWRTGTWYDEKTKKLDEPFAISNVPLSHFESFIL